MQQMWTPALFAGAHGARVRMRLRHADTGLVQVLQGRLQVDGPECYLALSDAPDLPERGYAELVLFAQGGVVKGNATCYAAGASLLRLLPSGPVQVTQRRLFYRVRTDHPVRLEVVSNYPTPGPAWGYPGRLLDLSLGGARLACSVQLVPSSTVRVTIPGTPAGDLRLVGQVRAIAAGSGPEWTAGLQWVRLPSAEMERLQETIVAVLSGLWGPAGRRRAPDPTGGRVDRARHLVVELAEALFRAQNDPRALYEALRITGLTIEELRDLYHALHAGLPGRREATPG